MPSRVVERNDTIGFVSHEGTGQTCLVLFPLLLPPIPIPRPPLGLALRAGVSWGVVGRGGVGLGLPLWDGGHHRDGYPIGVHHTLRLLQHVSHTIIIIILFNASVDR